MPRFARSLRGHGCADPRQISKSRPASRTSPGIGVVLATVPANGPARPRFRPEDAGMKLMRELFTDETGATMADYAVLLALVSVACMAAVSALSDQVARVVNLTASTLGSSQ